MHVFSPSSGRIVRHIESWDIDPWDGVKQVNTWSADEQASRNGGGTDYNDLVDWLSVPQVFTPGKQRRQDRD